MRDLAPGQAGPSAYLGGVRLNATAVMNGAIVRQISNGTSSCLPGTGVIVTCPSLAVAVAITCTPSHTAGNATLRAPRSASGTHTHWR